MFVQPAGEATPPRPSNVAGGRPDRVGQQLQREDPPGQGHVLEGRFGHAASKRLIHRHQHCGAIVTAPGLPRRPARPSFVRCFVCGAGEPGGARSTQALEPHPVQKVHDGGDSRCVPDEHAIIVSVEHDHSGLREAWVQVEEHPGPVRRWVPQVHPHLVELAAAGSLGPERAPERIGLDRVWP